MTYTDDILAKISSFGVLGYDISQIAILLDIPNHEMEAFTHDMETPGTEAYRSYQKGRQTGQYTLDKDLFEQAKGHDLTANTQMVDRMSTQKVNQAIHKKFKL